MKVHELIEKLSSLDPEKEIMIVDSFNGGGYPREINLGPTIQTITEEMEEECADCEGLLGEQVYIIGFGCY